MQLVEYMGKELLQSVGVRTPSGIVTNDRSYINLSYHKEKYRDFFYEHKNVMIKAQVPFGKRKKNGLIFDTDNYQESLKIIEKLYNTEFMDRNITTLLIEKKLDVSEELYLSIIYDTNTRAPMIICSREGGIDIEDIMENKAPILQSVDIMLGLRDYEARSIAKRLSFEGREIFAISNFIKKCYECFIKYDCKILEINPVILTKDGLLFAGDAKLTVDDNGVSRHEIFADITDIEDRSIMTDRELEARQIDLNDHRGVAGKTFMDLDGDIAVLASGGGASLICMDALIQAGGEPANYTEYSGNPPGFKVKQLTKITLSKPGLNGCLVIGGTANFTDIYETLKGFIEGLQEITPPPKYPIMIRRAGPRDKEAFEMIEEFMSMHDYNITLFGESTPMTKAVRILVDKVEAYKNGNTD